MALPDFVPQRLWLPYGVWTLADGSRVVHSRDYLPLWRLVGGRIERLAPWWWINGVQNRSYFRGAVGCGSWDEGDAQAAALAFLARHRIVGLPRLAEVLPEFFRQALDSGPEAVGEHLRSTGSGTPPPYARLNDGLG